MTTDRSWSLGRAKRSARSGDPCAQDGEHGFDATRAPPLYWVPPGEVAYRIEREQPHEDPNPDAEKVLRQRCRADDRTRGEYQPKGPCKNDRSAGAGDPIPGRQPTVILRSATPVCGCAPRCSSGQRELEEDDDAEQRGSGDTNLDLGHKVIVSDRGAEGDPAVRISLVLYALVIERVPHLRIRPVADRQTGDRYVWPSVVETVGRASHGVPQLKIVRDTGAPWLDLPLSESAGPRS